MTRVIDSELKVAAPADALTLGLLFTEIQDAVWAETKSPGVALNINSYRRSLQREYLRKMIGMVLRDAAVPEDARTLARQNLVTLRGQLQRIASRPGLSTSLEVRAHLNESIARIDETLKRLEKRKKDRDKRAHRKATAAPPAPAQPSVSQQMLGEAAPAE